MKRLLYLSIGSLFLGLGIVGAFVPVMPTTPFLLLSVGCYAKSSQYLHDYIINHPTFGPPVRDYFQHHGMRKRVKIQAIVALWLGILLSVFLIKYILIRILLLVVAICVSLYLLSLKTVK